MDMEFNLSVHCVIYPLPAISFRMIVILIYSRLLSYISYISLLQVSFSLFELLINPHSLLQISWICTLASQNPSLFL
jgi:hypothetical protein